MYRALWRSIWKPRLALQKRHENDKVMSNLQIGLAIAGGLLLACVVAHSAWSARKNQPKRATPETPSGESPTPTRTDGMAERQDPSFDGDSSLGSLSNLASLLAIDKKPGLDALIDVIAPVAVDEDVSGEAALAAMPATRRAGSKPFGVEGLKIAFKQHVPQKAASCEQHERCR